MGDLSPLVSELSEVSGSFKVLFRYWLLVGFCNAHLEPMARLPVRPTLLHDGFEGTALGLAPQRLVAYYIGVVVRTWHVVPVAAHHSLRWDVLGRLDVFLPDGYRRYSIATGRYRSSH